MTAATPLCAGCDAELNQEAMIIVHENACPVLPVIRADADGIPCTAEANGFCVCPRHGTVAA